MRFSENEMTKAVHGAAKSVLAARRDVRKGKQDVEDLWATMDKFQRFTLISQIADQVLPVLVALPDVEVAYGERPTYTDAQVQEAVESVSSDDLGRVKRAVALKARVGLVQIALSHVPLRTDPDTFEVPDHL